MDKNTILKTVALGVMAIGTFAIGTAIFARAKRKKDELDTVDALVKTDIIAQNFSGANGKTSKSKVHMCKRKDGSVYFSSKPCSISNIDEVGRMAGDYCRVGRGKGRVVGSDGTWQPDGHGGLDCVPQSSSAARMTITNNPIPRGAGFASVDSRLK